MKYLWLAALFLVSCMSPVMHFGAGKSSRQAQHDTLDELTPGRLSMEKRWNGPVAEAKIRVYADDDYRAQNHRWQQTFDERLDYANAVLAANFGVRLVADYREWDHHATGETLSEHSRSSSGSMQAMMCSSSSASRPRSASCRRRSNSSASRRSPAAT